MDGNSIQFLEHQIRQLEELANNAAAADQYAAAVSARTKLGELRHELDQHRRMAATQRRQQEAVERLGADPAWGIVKCGQPTKLTPELAADFFSLLRQGMGREKAALRLGLGASTMRRWLARGAGREEGGDGRHQAFLEGTLAAEAACQEQATAVVHNAMDPEQERDPKVRLRAAEFYLRNKFPEDFAPRSKVESTGKDGGPVAVAATVQPLFTDEQLQGMSPEQIQAALLGTLAVLGEDGEEGGA